MDQPSTSGVFNNNIINSSSLNLSITNKLNNSGENEEVDDDIEEIEIDESERLHLQKVTSFVEAAYQRVEEFSKQQPFLTPIPSAGASEGSSCASTVPPLGSLPESIEGGRAEIEELKNLPVSFESTLRTNQALQRRLTATLHRLEKTLDENLKKQAQLIDDEEEQGIIPSCERNSKDYKSKYFARPSSFSIPYFKDRCGMPAPMNNDTKFKVDHGYLDLYSTRLRTWLTSEQNLLVREVQKEYKNQLKNKWTSSLRLIEIRQKSNSVSEEEMRKINDEIEEIKTKIKFFTNVQTEKLEIPRGALLDWDKIAAQTFDGCRSAEECQLIWENYLHSDINQEPWSEDEDLKIQETLLSCKEKNPNWEEIAKSLNTRRTAFQVMQRWVSYIRPAIQPANWTLEQSKKLEDTINMLRVGNHIPWAQVAQHLTGFTKVQLQSRWRNINPDQLKGPFTVEEDFILIKGLYKFGMNFDVISHFLPGRSKVQVRERFKRAIMPGLTSQPWSLTEDKRIIHNCSFGNQHLRKMAMLLRKRDTCQIKLRFYVLHFWQSISGQKKLPPPLFPLSMTTKAAEVKKLREKIVSFDPSVRIVLDSIQTNNEGFKKVELSERRRNDKCELNKPKKLARFLEEKPDIPKKLKLDPKKKRRGSYGPRKHSWPDKALTEYFIPGRDYSSSNVLKNIGKDEKLNESFHHISQAFQLCIKENVSANDVKSLSSSYNINKADAKLINANLVEHHIMGDYGDECMACDQQESEIIPLIPANFFTMGAFSSLLLHKPKLEEMAAKEFLLYEIPRSQLHKLGDKPKTMNEVQVSQKLEITDDCFVDVNENSSDTNEENKEDGSTKKRKAAVVADIVNYVYSKEVKKPKLMKEPTICKEVLEAPTEEELSEMQLEGENPHFRHRTANKSMNESIIEEEDKLLFHRVLSLFFWPALLSQCQPDMEQLYLSKDLAEEKELNSIEIPEALGTEYNRIKEKFGEMDSEEKNLLIKKLESVRKQKRKSYKDCYLKPDVPLTMEDMKQRVFKKDIIHLKRSLIMKEAWSRKKEGKTIKKPKSNKVVPERTRPISARLASRLKKTRNNVEVDEEEEEEREQECAPTSK